MRQLKLPGPASDSGRACPSRSGRTLAPATRPETHHPRHVCPCKLHCKEALGPRSARAAKPQVPRPNSRCTAPGPAADPRAPRPSRRGGGSRAADLRGVRRDAVQPGEPEGGGEASKILRDSFEGRGRATRDSPPPPPPPPRGGGGGEGISRQSRRISTGIDHRESPPESITANLRRNRSRRISAGIDQGESPAESITVAARAPQDRGRPSRTCRNRPESAGPRGLSRPQL